MNFMLLPVTTGLGGWVGLLLAVVAIVVNEMVRRDVNLVATIAGTFKRMVSVFVHISVKFERRKE